MDKINIKLKKYFESILYPKNDKKLLTQLVNEELYSYLFSSYFCMEYENVICSKLYAITLKLINIIKSYYLNFHITYYNIQNGTDTITINAFIANIITIFNVNSGTFTLNILNLEETLKQLNIREYFTVIDEFIHKGQHIYSWFLYCQELDFIDKYDLNKLNLTKKYKFIAETISGCNNKKFSDINLSHQFVKKFLGKKYDIYLFSKNIYAWQISGSPSISELCNLEKEYVHSVRIIHEIEFQRFTNIIDKDAILKLWKDEKFSPPTICNDNYGKYDFGLANDMLIYPKLSQRELININMLDKQYSLEDEFEIKDKKAIIPWKGGCCYYYTNENSITAAISREYIKPRTTSYSGHTVLDLNLLSILDPDFDKNKYLYIFSILCTMIPFCHHTTHEVLASASFYDIEYDYELNFRDNYKGLCITIGNIFEIKNIFDVIEKKIIKYNVN